MSASDTRHWSTARKATIYFLAVLLPTILVLLLAKDGARLYIHVKHGAQGKSYGLWRYDEELGAVHAEDAYNTSYQTNDYGFRNREPVMRPKPAGALRIIAYGGSTTFCYNLPYGETWPAKLERLLRENHNQNDQVLNAGAIAWSLGHALARARRDIPDLKPDVVLIYSGINEDLNARSLAADGVPIAKLVGQGDYGKFATNLDQNQWLRRNIVSVKLLDHLLAPWIRPANQMMEPGVNDAEVAEAPKPALLENYRRTLERFIGLARAHGARVLFVVQTHGRNNSSNRYLTSYSRASVDVALAAGARVIDADMLVASYDGEPMDLFTASGVHYSPIGASMLADMIFCEAFESCSQLASPNSSGPEGADAAAL